MNDNRTHSVLMMKPMRVERTYTGGMLLDRWQGKEPAADGLMPEEWVASSTPSRYAPDPTTGLSRIANAELEDILLKDYISEDPAGILGESHYRVYGENQGFLTKIIDSDKRLNIQTHPDRTQSKILFNSDFGKSEAWYVMGGRKIDGEEPYILMGFKPGMTRERWEELVERQDIRGLEESLHKVPVREGDVFFIPSGMPHAIGSGCMIAEIQEPTDITFRVEKISRPGKTYGEETYHQGIGYERMFDCFDYSSYTEEGILEKTRISHPERKLENQTILTPIVNAEHTSFFAMDRIRTEGRWRLENRNAFAVAVILEGSGRICHQGEQFRICRSREIFLPCSQEPYEFFSDEGKTLSFLVCYPPERNTE